MNFKTKSYNFIADLISVWKKVHAMKWLFFYHRDFVVCYVYLLFCIFLIVLYMIFTLTLKKSIVKMREM